MPQLSLYIDQTTLKWVTETARAKNTSVSKLVTGILAQHSEDTWPPTFDAQFGRITDSSFAAPAEVDPALDIHRASL